MWFVCLLAFFGLLRICEYADGRLRWSALSVDADGLSLTIPFSKTSAAPFTLRIAFRGDSLCAKSACSALLSLVPWTDIANDAPVLCLSTSVACSRAAWTAEIKRLAASALAVDASAYAGHSFRRGGTTAMYLAGVPEAVIAAHGRWRSLSVRSYMSFDPALQQLATASLRHM